MSRGWKPYEGARVESAIRSRCLGHVLWIISTAEMAFVNWVAIGGKTLAVPNQVWSPYADLRPADVIDKLVALDDSA